jgi:hypothetical protein
MASAAAMVSTHLGAQDGTNVQIATGLCAPYGTDGKTCQTYDTAVNLGCSSAQDLALHWVPAAGGGSGHATYGQAQTHYCATSVATGTECGENLVGYTNEGHTTCMPIDTMCTRTGGCSGGTARR